MMCCLFFTPLPAGFCFNSSVCFPLPTKGQGSIAAFSSAVMPSAYLRPGVMLGFIEFSSACWESGSLLGADFISPGLLSLGGSIKFHAPALQRELQSSWSNYHRRESGLGIRATESSAADLCEPPGVWGVRSVMHIGEEGGKAPSEMWC